MTPPKTITAGKGRYKVWLRAEQQGEDWVLRLGGGERPHIGCVVLCEPGKKPRLIKLATHMDHIVAVPIARRFAEKHGRTVCVAGIHINDATKEEIRLIVSNCKAIEAKI